jgi:manganese-dependent ADP-ribose/CDP-alcohol diphosphatase
MDSQPAKGRKGVNRAQFLRFLGAGVIAGTSRAEETRPAGSPVLSIGILTDCQYADADTPPNSKRLYRESPKKLAAAIDHLNTMGDLDFMLHLGDAVDRDEKSYEVVMPVFAKAKVPLYQIAGNHDYSIAAELKMKVPQLLGMKAPHYSIVQRGWRFVMLDGNLLSLFSTPQGSPGWKTASAFLKASKRKLTDYSGGLGEDQITWLKSELSSARKAGERVVLVCHYPLLPIDGHSLWDAEAVLEVLKADKDLIAAWWNGHNHDGNYAARHGIHFLNFRGMVETAENSYARVDIYPDRMEVAGYGREPRRVLRFPAQDTPERKRPQLPGVQ